MGYRKVLVAFDGSKGSMDALKQGMDYMKDDQFREFTIVNVVNAEPEPAYVAPGAIPPVVQRNEVQENKQVELVEKGEQTINEAKTALIKENMHANIIVLEGEPAKRICDYAEEHEMDLIIIGNRGLSGLKKLVQGSVSQKVTKQASCSVLVVK
ncbi:universal stress protein [Pseudalkalibacillus decolorationis]|uniref:universal stress protein n=1 Tax=Pseudalkalibacillus decolorationis TaxID=163879 RepID=UPI002148C0FC|nr:universal stress protein [Pseudalkalibacillus decolorationis]